ncbi:MAG: hypothetical protein KJ566_02740 [Nanoarchaeota archaeon]|nr:hypothetical protein [Nanoarchaeota archaeon]
MVIKKIFLFSLFFLFSLSFIFACSPPGPIDATHYCGIDGISYFLLGEGEECLNDYECQVGSCSEGTCGSAFSGVPGELEESTSFLWGAWEFLTGEQCENPGQDVLCGAEGTSEENMTMFVCGALKTWEDNEGALPAFVNGKCGYEYVDLCGNTNLDRGEECDGNSQYCGYNSWLYLQEKKCNSNCLGWGTCIATEYCGDLKVNGREKCDGTENCIESGEERQCFCEQGYFSDLQGKCVKDDLTGKACVLQGEECRDGNLFICNSILLEWFNIGKVNGKCNYNSSNVWGFGNITNGNYVPSEPWILNLISNITGLNDATKIAIEFFDTTDVFLPANSKALYIFEINVDAQTAGTLNFKLGKSGVTNFEDVSLYILENEWVNLSTGLVSSDATLYFYKSNIPHFSLFMITDVIDEEWINPPGGGGGNGGDSCTPDWKCGGWSLETCGTRTCIDVKKCKTVVGKPLQTKDCSDGGYCGDGECDGYEDCGYTNNAPECVSDCGACRIGVCGDGVCDADESSYLCADDCDPVKPKSKLWIFILIIVLLIVGIIGIIFLIRRRLKKDKQSFTSGPGNVLPSQPRMPPRSPPGSIARGYPAQAYNSGFHS